MEHEDIANFAKDCVKYLDFETIEFSLMKINISLNSIKKSYDDIGYMSHIISYLLNRAKLGTWLNELNAEGYFFAKSWVSKDIVYSPNEYLSIYEINQLVLFIKEIPLTQEIMSLYLLELSNNSKEIKYKENLYFYIVDSIKHFVKKDKLGTFLKKLDNDGYKLPEKTWVKRVND